MFMVAMLLALIGYLLFPTAPPRLLAGERLHRHDRHVHAGSTQDSQRGQPAGQQVRGGAEHAHRLRLDDRRPAVLLVAQSGSARSLWALYPLLVLFVIVVTGNHFWFDAAAGAARRASPRR